jgi:hypothetical protein
MEQPPTAQEIRLLLTQLEAEEEARERAEIERMIRAIKS